MAKPNAQTGYGPSSGAADESALPDGETSRRGADAGAAGPPAADWGVADAHDESSISRVLGLILVVVLVGVFSFVAYRKYNEAKLHPQTEAAGGIDGIHGANSADSRVADHGEGEHGAAGFNAGENEPAGSGATGRNPIASDGAAPNGAPGTASSLSQLDEPANSNAPFHPTNGGSAAEQPGEQPGGRSTKTGQVASRESEVNPFSDVATNTPPSNAASEKSAQAESNPTPAGASNRLRSQEVRNDQSEPLFNEGAGEKRAAASPPRQEEPLAASARNASPAQTTSTNPNAPNESGWNGSSKPQDAGPSARSASTQLQPVRTAQSDSFSPTGRIPTQNDPAAHDLLNERPQGAEIARNEPQSIPHNAAARPTIAPGSLLDQEEPAPTTARRESVPSGGAPSAGNAFSPATSPQTGEASSSTTVHLSSAKPPATDNEDLFATKTADATSKSGLAPVPQSPASARLSGNVGADATLNDAGDVYVVQPQDTFWTISRKKYGTARYFQALAELNKAHVPDATRMRPGVKVSTPPTEILETRYSQFLPKGSAIEVASGERPAGKSGPAGFFTSADGKPMYRTGEKDTLSGIAAKHLGRASRWIQVYEMNRDKLSSPNQLKIGTELVLPADASNVALTNENDVRR
jgi:nucleoid-associated protein YgaU